MEGESHEKNSFATQTSLITCAVATVCVCVCVCVREREREREGVSKCACVVYHYLRTGPLC